MRKINLASLLLACSCLHGCLFSGGGKEPGGAKPLPTEEKPQPTEEKPQPTEEKPRSSYEFYTFIHPTASSRWNLDSFYTVQWQASDSAGDGPIRGSLYRNDTLLDNLFTSYPASGSVQWDFSVTRFLGNFRQGSGSGYQFRFESASDPSKGNFGPRFTLYSDYSGSLEVQGAQAGRDSILRIAWSRSGDVGTSVGLQLYRDTTLVHTLSTSAPASDGGFSWSFNPDYLASGNNYRIRIFAMSDPSIGQMSPPFSITAATLVGTYGFLFPRAGEICVAGSAVNVKWSVTGNPGPFSMLTLWRDSPRKYIEGWTPYDTHTPPEIFYVPADLASGTYRLRIASLIDTALYAFSPPIRIQGADSIVE